MNSRYDIEKAYRDGKSFNDVRREVLTELCNIALVDCYGNQTDAADKLNVNRGTLRKYIGKHNG